MDYQKFCELLKGEKLQSIIFKEECNALKGSPKDNAELAKEIIALANNETKTNYIVIGVSAESRKCRTVNNPKLTDENLQDFCKEYIEPQPVVKLHQLQWKEAADPEHQGKLFIVIEAEAQSRQCFRFNQDLIDYQEQYVFRKGEVWVRHETSIDLASPEEIKKLFERKVNAKKKGTEAHRGVSYTDLPYVMALPLILNELERLAISIGGKFHSDMDPFIIRGGPSFFHHVVLPINDQPLLLRVVPVERCTERGQFDSFCQTYLTFEHGLMLLSLGDVSEAALNTTSVKIRQNWGWVCTNDFWHLGLQERGLNLALPEKIKEEASKLVSSCIILANVESDLSLQKSWYEMINFLKQKEDFTKIVNVNQSKINTILSFFLKEGCLKPASSRYIPKKLLANEYYNPERYGNVLLIKQPELCEALANLVQKCKL